MVAAQRFLKLILRSGLLNREELGLLKGLRKAEREPAS